VGAGVLCFSRDDRGEIVLLLGREREVLGWRQGSRKWGGFSGRAEAGESAEEAAAREFLEETCACVPITERAYDPPGLARALRAAPSLELTLRGPEPDDVLSHVTFFFELPYDPGLEPRFQALRAELAELDAAFRGFYRLKKGTEHLPRLALPGYVLGAGAVTVDFEPEAQDRLRVLYEDAAGEQASLVLQLSPAAYAEALRLREAWTEVLDFVRARADAPVLSHPAVCLTRARGRLLAAYVNKAFLEKSDVRWWPLAELERLARERWRGGDAFRRYFLDNLCVFAPRVRSLAEARAAPP